ncbi:hypothetical protein KR067_010380, partial [Drosophila pandora]
MCFLVPFFKRYLNRNPRRFVFLTHVPSVALVLAGTKFFLFAEMLYVVPQIISTGSVIYFLLWLLSLFVAYNIIANLLAAHFTDTSVGSLPKERQNPKPHEEHMWHFCDKCMKMVPPRSWHCKLCRCCILRRDHHCIFTATCVGLKNQRYFFWFNFYMTLGTAIALATNYFYLFTENNSLAFLQVRFTLNIFMAIDYGLDWDNWSIWMDLIVLINVFAFVAPVIMLGYQVALILANATFHKSSESVYNLGVLENIRIILGNRWYWTFLSPVIQSPLPLDG